MIRMESSKKNIKIGEYYVKVNDIYVVGDGGDLELLERLYVAEGYPRVVFEETIGDKGDVRYHYFSFDIKAYKIYNSIQGLLEQFGDVVVFNLNDIQPNKKFVKKVAGFLEKKNIVIFSILIMAVAGTALFFKSKKNKPSSPSTPIQMPQAISKPQQLQQPLTPPPPPPCHTNLPNFAKLFDYSDQVSGSKIIKSINDKTIEMPLQSTEVAPVEKADIKIPETIDEKLFNMQDTGDRLVFTINGYDNCLLFIDANKKLPLIIDTLNTENCSIYLEKSCIKG
jgi:hypothetical protein